MKDNRTLALIGAALLFVGVFMPILSVPIVGSINYFANGNGDGSIVLALAIVAAALAMTRRVRHVLWPGLGSLGVMGYTFYRFQRGMSEMRAKMETELADNPFRGLAEAAMGTMQIQWGWAVLVLGALLLVWAGIAERRGRGSPPTA